MDAETYPAEVLAEEEPRYLRRQKPVEIKRRKFGKRAWKTYLRVSAWVVVGTAAAGLAYEVAEYLYTSPQMALLHPEQIELAGNHYVSRASVLEVFVSDRGRSVLRVPLDERRRLLEAIPWVEQATVRRALPNRIQVEVIERTPVAFLRQGAELALVDTQGVILERPLEGDFHFPVVSGIDAGMRREERARRLQMLVAFLQDVDRARVGAGELVSEVDLSDAADLRATLERLPAGSVADAAAAGPIVVHFGNGDFQNKYRVLLENIGQWRATAGRVDSVDLRFNGQVVVNPESPVVTAKAARPGR
ncbi:MAG TPA: FtsQ-type POTRA domain-containing protein [Candidatus Acidoferrales bacterium]|jgi:cell division protein FtsQ|nr:FtsQ-type POTRA domain-containing protein [Candidatus Acidoferrales bacterium]